MASRIFWVFIAGLALVTGMVLQDGDRIFSWADDEAGISARTERAIDANVDRVVDRSVYRMKVVGSDGEEIDVSSETKRAMAEAVGRLVKAEANLALLGIRDADADDIAAASVSRDQARTEVETLKAEIERQRQLSRTESEAVSEQIQRQVRDDVRDAVRDAVKN